MYESYTHQALPSKKYRELLGTALYVFNSNNAFIIENVLRLDASSNWYNLIDLTSGTLKNKALNNLNKEDGENAITVLFEEIIDMRNRIIHSFGITTETKDQILATKTKIKEGNDQFRIAEEYLMEFIQKNDELSNLLHKLRGY